MSYAAKHKKKSNKRTPTQKLWDLVQDTQKLQSKYHVTDEETSLATGYVIIGRNKIKPKVRRLMLYDDKLNFVSYKGGKLVKSLPLAFIIRAYPSGAKKCFVIETQPRRNGGRTQKETIETPSDKHRSHWINVINKQKEKDNKTPRGTRLWTQATEYDDADDSDSWDSLGGSDDDGSQSSAIKVDKLDVPRVPRKRSLSDPPMSPAVGRKSSASKRDESIHVPSLISFGDATETTQPVMLDSAGPTSIFDLISSTDDSASSSAATDSRPPPLEKADSFSLIAARKPAPVSIKVSEPRPVEPLYWTTKPDAKLGMQVVKDCGMVTAVNTGGRVASDIRPDEISSAVEAARSAALSELVGRTQKLGGNALLGVGFSTSINQWGVSVVAYGSAVIQAPKPTS